MFDICKFDTSNKNESETSQVDSLDLLAPALQVRAFETVF